MAKTSVLKKINKIAYIRDVKTAGTNGGTFTGGSYQIRDLNELIDDAGIVTSLTGNIISLPAGTYDIEFSAPTYSGVNAQLQQHKAKFQSTTNSAVNIIGSSEYNERIGSGSVCHIRSVGIGRLVLAAPDTFQLQHRCTTTMASTGFGVASGFTDVEVYSIVKITKVD
jgi:hypothetical protein